MEYEDDDGDSYTQTKRLNILLTDTGFGSQSHASATPVASDIHQTKSRRLHGATGKSFVFKCLQCVLQRVTPLIVDHLYLTLERDKLAILRQNVLHSVRLMWIRLVKKVFMVKTPTIIDLFSVVYLSLRQLNEVPVFIDDYLLMMKENKVPFINAILLLPPTMVEMMPAPTSFVMLTPVSVPLDDQFHRNVLRWTDVLSLDLIWTTSADSFHLQAYKLFYELRIPQASALLLMYHKIVWKVTNGVFQAVTLRANVGAEIQAISLMFFVVNLYFVSSPKVVPIQQFNEWLSEIKATKPYMANKMHRMEPRELLDLSESQILEYCDWIYDTLLPPKNKDGQENSEMISIEKKLFKIFPYQSNERRELESVSHPQVKDSFPLIPNTLTKSDLVGIKNLMTRFFCEKFGMAEKLLIMNCRKIELLLLRIMKTEKVIK